MKTKTTLITAVLSLGILLAGCNSKDNFENYKEEVTDLYDSIAIANVKLNGLETYSEESQTVFFETLTDLKQSFKDFSETEAPEEFSECTDWAQNAYESLSVSEQLFHDALDDEFDQDCFDKAVDNYNNVITYVNYIGLILEQKSN